MTWPDWHAYVKDMGVKRGLSMEVISALLAYVDRLHSRGLPAVFDLEHLSRLVGIQRRKLAAMVYMTERFYNHFRIPKRSGEERDIQAPTLILKECQRWILRNILEKVPVTNKAHGFVPGRSILTNAAAHVGKPMVLNLDIRDFFPSIRWKKVFNLFRSLGYSKKVCFYLTSLTTYRGALPQGAPTSPLLSNLIVRHLDLRLSRLAQKLGLDYTRYADDITFSGEANVLSVIPIIRRILKDEEFVLNESKIRVMRSHKRQEVTGLVVNRAPAVRASQVRWLRQRIYYLHKFGPQDCESRMHTNRKNLREFLYGHALFVRMVNAIKGDTLLAQLNCVNW